MVWVSGHRRHGPANIAVARQGDLVDRGGCARPYCAGDWHLAVLAMLAGMGRDGAGGETDAIRTALPCHAGLFYFLASLCFPADCTPGAVRGHGCALFLAGGCGLVGVGLVPPFFQWL